MSIQAIVTAVLKSGVLTSTHQQQINTLAMSNQVTSSELDLLEQLNNALLEGSVRVGESKAA